MVRGISAPLALSAPLTLYEPTVGTAVTLRVVIDSGVPTQIRWFKEGQAILMFGNSLMSGATTSNPSLTISSVRMADAGSYICQGTDGFATKNTSAIRLSPQASPSYPVLTGPTTIIFGKSGTWQCVTKGGFPEPTMSLRIGDSTFSEEFSVRSIQDPSDKTYTLTGTLSWSPSMQHDAKTMHCEVTHRTLNAALVSSLPLSVKSPLAVYAPMTFYDPMEEESVTLACTVTDGTATSIRWFKDAQPINIPAYSRFSGGSVGTPSLTITELQMSDAGSYICEAADAYTQVRTNSIMLATKEKPATEYNIITKILKGYNKLVRPRDPVVNLTHSLIPFEMIYFDQMKLVLHTMQCISWNDPRLSWTKGQPRVSLPSSVIWIPDIVLFGHKFVPHDNDTKAIIMKDGTVTYCPHGYITATDCAEYSGAKFECSFRFVSWSYDIGMLDEYYPVMKPSIDMSIYREHNEFEIYQRCSTRNEVSFVCRPGTYPQLTYKFVIRRNKSFCIDRTRSPSCYSMIS